MLRRLLRRQRPRPRDTDVHPATQVVVGLDSTAGRRAASRSSRGRASRSDRRAARRRNDSRSSGSTRSSSPPWLLAATAMLPSTRKASPPNIRFSVTPSSRLDRHPDPVGQVLVVRHADQRVTGDRQQWARALRPASAARHELGPQPARPRRLADRRRRPDPQRGRLPVRGARAGCTDEDLAAFGELGVSHRLRPAHDARDRRPARRASPTASRRSSSTCSPTPSAPLPPSCSGSSSDPALAGEQLGDGQAERYFESAYRGVRHPALGARRLPPALRGHRGRGRTRALPLRHRQGPHRLGDRRAVLAARRARRGGDGGVPPHQHRPAPRRTAVDRPVRRTRAATPSC